MRPNRWSAQPVKLLEKVERSIELLVEGIPQTVFRQKLQPAELGRKLEREMLRQQQAGLGANLVPNHFDVALNPADFERFSGFRSSLENQMESWLTQVAQRKGCVFVDRVEVTLRESSEAGKRNPQIVAKFSDHPGNRPQSAGHTSALPSARPSANRTAHLTLLSGNGHERSFIVPAGSTTIGRAPENDIVLDSQDVSRRHARIDCSTSGIRIHDLGSTNGTCVNGDNVSVADLADRDVIHIGSQRLRIDMTASRGAR
jgi:hypothetical protein